MQFQDGYQTIFFEVYDTNCVDYLSFWLTLFVTFGADLRKVSPSYSNMLSFNHHQYYLQPMHHNHGALV